MWIFIKKIIKKLKVRFIQFRNHPITRKDPINSLLRYIFFHIRIYFFDEITYNWVEGLKIYIRKIDPGIVGNVFYGLYEFEESMLLLHFLKEKDLFLDIGSNVGHYSLLVSGVRKCKSISIEPVPKTYMQLIRQIELNQLSNLIETRNIGISNKKGELYFSNDRGTMDKIVSKEYKNSVKIKVSSLDEIITDLIPIAMKIDVEGYEKFVLKGAEKLLKNKKLKIVILELNQSGKSYGVDDLELYDEMINYGFAPFSYDAFNRELKSLKTYNIHKFNTIFIRDKKVVEKRILNSKGIRIRGVEL